MCRQRKYPSQLSKSPRKLRRHATDLAAMFVLGRVPTARSCGGTHKRREQLVSVPESLTEYLRTFTQELGERILQSFPPLYAVDDRPSPLIARLLRMTVRHLQVVWNGWRLNTHRSKSKCTQPEQTAEDLPNKGRFPNPH